ncbi:hypothetical protein LTR48_006804 [Friedmanniomyces endolithicus]|uniref:Zn(2)-C6 fungal-type domain-containing protein n=1 Tax=Rachicladosporium monterosium TaxID=1507873 RepID=A0ABR0KXX3_9PEZI|nr:hypothetical protein LTR48_006804 [Friedmanniomyces endolithicus]KAK5140381.1 hypothetical protein LTR32_006800 [Rachicladosporium monterosium]
MIKHEVEMPPGIGNGHATIRPLNAPSQQLPIAIAPAVNGQPRAQDVAPGSMAFTCVTCTRRKVKCDKTGPPCSTCRKTRLQCHYEAPPPRKRKRRPTDDIHERLEHYEGLLRQHGILDQADDPSPVGNAAAKIPSPSDTQLSGTGIALAPNAWDTKQPLNLDDTDLHPDMPETPSERIGATDMLFCLLRCEMGKFYQKIKPFSGDWGRMWELGDPAAIREVEAMIGEMENNFETKYMRYCDPVTPIHFLALLLGRGAPQNARLRLRLARVRACDDVDEVELRELWRLAMRMFDYDRTFWNTLIVESEGIAWR